MTTLHKFKNKNKDLFLYDLSYIDLSNHASINDNCVGLVLFTHKASKQLSGYSIKTIDQYNLMKTFNLFMHRHKHPSYVVYYSIKTVHFIPKIVQIYPNIHFKSKSGNATSNVEYSVKANLLQAMKLNNNVWLDQFEGILHKLHPVEPHIPVVTRTVTVKSSTETLSLSRPSRPSRSSRSSRSSRTEKTAIQPSKVKQPTKTSKTVRQPETPADDSFDYVYYLMNNIDGLASIAGDQASLYQHYLEHVGSGTYFTKKENYSNISPDYILKLNPNINSSNEREIFIHFIQKRQHRLISKNDLFKYTLANYSIYKYAIWSEYTKQVICTPGKHLLIFVYNGHKSQTNHFLSRVNHYVANQFIIYVLYAHDLPSEYKFISNIVYVNVSYYSSAWSAFAYLLYNYRVYANRFVLLDSSAYLPNLSYISGQLNRLTNDTCLIGSHKINFSGSNNIQEYPHLTTNFTIFSDKAVHIWHSSCILIDLLYSINQDVIAKSNILITKSIEEQHQKVHCLNPEKSQPMPSISYFEVDNAHFENINYTYSFVFHIYQDKGFELLAPYIKKIAENRYNLEKTLFVFSIAGTFTKQWELDGLLKSAKHFVCLKSINVGLDTGGFLIGCLWMKQNLSHFPEYVCKIHSKGAHATHHHNMLDDIMDSLIVSPVEQFFTPEIGMYGPSKYYLGDGRTFRSNLIGISYLYYKTYHQSIECRLGSLSKGFYAGTMFWIRGSILSDSLSLELIHSYLSDLNYGPVGPDCHLPHAWERFYSVLVQEKQYKLYST